MCVYVCIMLSSHRHATPSATTTIASTTTTAADGSAKAAEANPYETLPPYTVQSQPVVGGSMNYKCEHFCNLCG